MKSLALLLGCCLVGSSASATVACTETITSVINHSGGNVYFMSDQTCAANWCQLSGSADFIKRGHAMLMAAQLSGKKVSFNWPGLTSCTANAVYASPEFMWTQ